MDLKTLHSIFEIGETVAVEFKRCGNGIEADTYETVCSFLNRFGGDIFLGVLDDGTVVGVPPKAAPDMVRNLFKYSKYYSGKEPEFMEGDVFRIMVPLDDEYSYDYNLLDSNVHNITFVSERKQIYRASEKNIGVKLNHTQREILNLLLENCKLTADEMASSIGISRRNIEANIRKLKDYGILYRHGSPKKGYWEVVDKSKTKETL
ncbi:MAG: winged helix-turn-helix transcriptional regulator [Eubacterium sp.]|jgi:predicted HTH transcriptional regulator